MHSEIHREVDLAQPVVISGNELDILVVKGSASLSITVGWCHCESLNNQASPSVGLDALPSSFRPLLPHLLDAVMFVGFLQVAGQIHDSRVGSGNMEGHAKELAIQLRNDLAQSLAGANESRDDILGSAVCQRG